jgi:hypothetical protein
MFYIGNGTIKYFKMNSRYLFPEFNPHINEILVAVLNKYLNFFHFKRLYYFSLLLYDVLKSVDKAKQHAVLRLSIATRISLVAVDMFSLFYGQWLPDSNHCVMQGCNIFNLKVFLSVMQITTIKIRHLQRSIYYRNPNMVRPNPTVVRRAVFLTHIATNFTFI